MSEERFNLSLVKGNLQNSLETDEEQDVNLKFYLDSYEELNKFFLSLGSIFGFVSSDLMHKIGILKEFIKNDEVNFITVKKMIEYEEKENLLDKSGYVSGSRTLLRLHRGLDFIKLFLNRVLELKDTEGTSHVCRASYNETLAKYHSFFIVQGARIAMCTLPTKDELFKKVCAYDIEHIKRSLEEMPETLDIMNKVYNIVDSIYVQHNLHNLP